MGGGADGDALCHRVGDLEQAAQQGGHAVAQNTGEDDGGHRHGGHTAQLLRKAHADGGGHTAVGDDSLARRGGAHKLLFKPGIAGGIFALGDAKSCELTVLFCDIRGFSINSEMMTAKENFAFAKEFDLQYYVNLFGYSPKYGIDGKPIGSITYKPQGFEPGTPLYLK